MAELTEISRFDAGTNFKLNLLWSEFENVSVEHAFQQHQRAAHHTALVRTLVFCSLFYVAFAVTDIGALGSSRAAFTLFLARCLVALTCGICLRAANAHHNSVPALRAAASVVEVVGFAVFMLITWLRPGGMSVHDMSMCIMLIVAYSFIPNKLIYALGINVVATVAFIAISAASRMLDPSSLLTSSMLLVFTNALGFVTARRHNRLARDEFCQHALLRNLSVRDYLTSCFNRRYLTDVLFNAELKRARKTRSILAVVLCDIDLFKQINDNYGHPAGDAVIRTFSALLLANTRHDVDSVIRYGGEEFVLLLPRTDITGATALAERMRQAFETAASTTWDGREIRATASFGVVVVNCARDTARVTEDSVIGAADAQLYRAKDLGRNRVCVNTSPIETDQDTAEGMIATA
jgi:diguanylate cyclase (GGDEF)-like protein